ncbi:MAG: hypothetical protein LKF87_08150 [Clostridium tyrobutyricum]|uniref:Uncharacterized protein n=1 Tax=Clostridium tetanomorphum TaxID=1553 RepID=A0A923J352_CLOTT|nr:MULTISPECIES: hypothetical protein [Clostridium]MBC2399683.1 hypothetical protein [Clostridium tetanomorphum]MBV4420342.1 hypothetical protein [Clostridium tyrobutyricum]MCH4198540.1 hypothetical protein [Clostridium tyrobutyricum]MCH4238254.1 hypothetical protein [Clostridium tyrobutyricum]MCH4258924.1 hypothetical protein [Clostridium tyrobutyricum]
MKDLFKKMIEDNFHRDIFNSLQEEIMDKYDQYDLTLRANVVQEVLEASLDSIDVLRIFDINQDEKKVNFNVLISCDIEISDYAYNENISELVCQWFKLKCSAILENAVLKDFTVKKIEAYNK